MVIPGGHEKSPVFQKVFLKQQKSVKNKKSVGVMSSAPVCSKTKKFLINNGIVVKGL